MKGPDWDAIAELAGVPPTPQKELPPFPPPSPECVDAERRRMALSLAVDVAKVVGIADSEDIVASAEAFRVFLIPAVAD